MTASLYIHIPFCVSHCDYCDFYSELALRLAPPSKSDSSGLLHRYVTALKGELDWALSFYGLEYGLEHVPTLYIGGGTPTVLGLEGLEALLLHLSHVLPNWPAEVTLEANPESVNEDILSMLRCRGVNRLSLGIQSFHEPSRLAVHRSGTVDQCFSALDIAGQYFPQAFSVDLMAGLPFQTAQGLCADIQRVLDAGTNHVSLYSLILEATTPLARYVRAGTIHLPSEEEAEDIWLAGRDALTARGLLTYEVSNFAVPGYESRHNMRYWRMESWIGCGPGASTTLIDEKNGTGQRLTNRPDLQAYFHWAEKKLAEKKWADKISPRGEMVLPDESVTPDRVSPPADREFLDQSTLMKESLMMGFRTIAGPDEALFEARFHQSIGSLIGRTISLWKKRGLFQKDRWALTSEGLLLLNSFLVDCFQELEQQGL
ncbi:radical SAM family heme chaperone HemW [Gracilinema caldarium]|uniref:Heme chaperone HemW n=1 Tax=Gracilinema caldarium (strain ATCC 51460 / DSM 7334 / H1) TaxID=744872 RepID=F8F2Q4_GRAC1|nr:radical SAM family heme chaperone HemW [Gracilinema caldarium]AEJ19448.1 oxygen-independent coproporphyrinogen III oxidase [Gracilinema caldarium DSM 7334]